VPDVRIIAVACVGPLPLPSLTLGAVRSRFRGDWPDVPVWLDFDDRVKKQFGFTPGVPNVAVVDSFGRLRCLATGPLTAEQYDRLGAIVEALRREAVLGR
jgi:hypothetical protein